MSPPTRIGPAVQRRVSGNALWTTALRGLRRAVSAADPDPVVHDRYRGCPLLTEADNAASQSCQSGLRPNLGRSSARRYDSIAAVHSDWGHGSFAP